ncbi:LLM class flavin-dependent oxidoreductase [Actinomycetes bacterium M1A6_2h]
MKFNIMVIPKLPGTDEERRSLRPMGRNPERFNRMIPELLELAKTADDFGFDSFSTTEHHFHTEGVEVMSAPLIFYTYLAAQTKKIKFIPLSIVLPAANPLRVAEEVAMFDQLYPGRIEVGFARGYQNRWMQTISQRELIASGVPESDAINREIFDEYLEVVVKSWTEDAFDFDGKHFQVPFPHTGIKNWPTIDISREYGADGEVDDDGLVRKIGVIPPPYSQPHPQIWMPFSLSPATLSNAATRGFNMLLLASEPDQVRGFCERYQAEANAAGRNVGLGEGVCAVRQIAIGDTFEEAFDTAVRSAGWDFYSYFQKFGFMEAWRSPEDAPDQPVRVKNEREAAQRLLDSGALICGTVDDVKRKLEQEETCYGDGHLQGVSWQFYHQGNTTLDEQRRQLDLFGSKVMPAFQ